MPLVPTNLLYDFAAEAAAPAQAYVAGEIPKAVLVASAKGYAASHGMAGGTIMALVSAAIMGAYRSLRGGSNGPGPQLRGGRSRARAAQRPPRLRLPGSVSSSQTVTKRGSMPVVASGLDVVEPALKLSKLKSDQPKSVWSSLRDLATGKKIIKNSFTFKMKSQTDLRGLMAIPLRHDADMDSSDADWAVGMQSMQSVAASNDFKAHKTMMVEPSQTTWTQAPIISTDNVIVPRMNLPMLEQTSWDLNGMKLMPEANLMGRVTTATGTRQDMVAPVMQLGGSAVPYGSTSTTNGYEHGYPAARDSYARYQSVTADSNDPETGHFFLPRFKTQLGGGSLTMRMCNQGMNMCTVEFCVLKVVNPYLCKVNPSVGTSNTANLDGGDRVNMSYLWGNLYNTVGYEYAKKTKSNLSYKMGDASIQPDENKLKLDPLQNPYKTWLPSSCFKARSDLTDQYSSSNLGVQGGLTVTDPTAYAQNPLAATGASTSINDAVPFSTLGGGGQYNPYRCVSRGHCTISAAAERKVVIPIPGSNYDASQLQSQAVNYDRATKINTYTPCPVSDETYIVLVSVNGSLQDVIEPQVGSSGNSKDSIKVIGKAYTEAIVDFHCVYTETVYPSHCDYASITPVAFNLGRVQGPQTEGSSHSYAGKVMSMADAIPVTQAGVLRTGASDRAGDNAGATEG